MKLAEILMMHVVPSISGKVNSVVGINVLSETFNGSEHLESTDKGKASNFER